ncbi:MAG: serine hydrolase [Bacilli bacterium]|nr:serine hydrolase [Bacilli bacterium]
MNDNDNKNTNSNSINDNDIFNVDLFKNDDSIEKQDVKQENINSSVIDNESLNNKIGNDVNINYSSQNVNEESLIDSSLDNNKDNDKEERKSILSIFNNRKFLTIMGIITFICVCIVVGKAFYYGKRLDDYEEVFITIDKKDEKDTKVVADQNIDTKVLKNVAASSLIGCINSKIDTNDMPDSVNSKIKEINDYYNSSNNYFAFSYKDLYTGFTVSYNANQNIFSASSIKAPKDIYLYEMASQGKVNLDEELTYTSAYYNTGSGLLKNKPVNTKYKVRTLLQYSTVDSDNAAHNMLMDRYGRENILKFWQEKGTTGIFTLPTNWGVTNAHDATIYMEELYKFYISNDEYGGALMNNFLNSYPKFIKGKNGYKIASKSGWAGSVLHEMTIVFADNPYIVIGLSNLGDKGNYQEYFDKVNDLAYNLHLEYWKYKMSKCQNIKQY